MFVPIAGKQLIGIVFFLEIKPFPEARIAGSDLRGGCMTMVGQEETAAQGDARVDQRAKRIRGLAQTGFRMRGSQIEDDTREVVFRPWQE